MGTEIARGACALAMGCMGVLTACTSPVYGYQQTVARPGRRFPVPDEPALGGSRGDWEFTIASAGNADDEVDRGGLRLATSIGYYLADPFLLALRQNIVFEDNVNDTSNLATRLALDFIPTNERLRPFLGANIGTVYGESVNETLTMAPETGMKLYLQDRTFLQFIVEFQIFFTKTEDKTEILDRGEFVYSIGLGINF